ncbi:MAG: hypothetical protein LBR17_04590 [Bacteroidales bacterium]|jgi:hypothetical protein|nr:hypothetical protein [Bacteroidales bacterium]
MKKILLGLMSLAVVATMTMAFVIKTETNSNADENSCTITIKDKRGLEMTESKVTIFYCSGGSDWKDFYTDRHGKVTVKWAKNCELKKVCCKGECHKVSYENGGSYTLTLDDKYIF